MNRPVFKSNHGPFFSKNDALKDMVMGHMAMDIEVGIKTTAGTPVSNTKASGNKRGGGGHMKASARHFRAENGKFRVEVDKVYAASQEVGIVNGHPVKHYSTPGTSSRWFQRAINGVIHNKSQYISEAKGALGL